MKKFFITIFFIILFYPIFLFINYNFFKSIFNAQSLIFPYAIHPFDIIQIYPYTWVQIKKWYFITFSFSYFIFFYNTITFISFFIQFPKINLKKNRRKNTGKIDKSLKLLIGYDNNEKLYLDEKGLYQNILVTGTIGTGKTSSIMYPFTKQLIDYYSNNKNEKISMLVLDVKGNYYEQVLHYSKLANRLEDVVIIDLSGNVTYNPLDKPNLTPVVLANRLKTILTIFSPNNQESYWLDKIEQVITECIKFCRLYNNGYVTFSEIHKLVLFDNYFNEKLSVTKTLFRNNNLSEEQIYDLLTCIDFFEKEFFSLDQRTLSILRSEISRITNLFISDYNVSKVFCPPKNKITFSGFKESIENGKIVVLNMNIAEYRNLSKIIASYLKLDFQTEVLSQLKNYNSRKTAFISDEYHEYVTTTDADFFSVSREAKCINIVATQSYSSIRNALKDDISSNVIIQNLINKIWFRTDDLYTIEEIQKQLGKEEQEKISTTISENARETKFNYVMSSLISSNSSISESINKYTQKDFIYDYNYFSQKLKTFTCLCFISDGMQISIPKEVTSIPYYKNKERRSNEKI